MSRSRMRGVALHNLFLHTHRHHRRHRRRVLQGCGSVVLIDTRVLACGPLCGPSFVYLPPSSSRSPASTCKRCRSDARRPTTQPPQYLSRRSCTPTSPRVPAIFALHRAWRPTTAPLRRASPPLLHRAPRWKHGTTATSTTAPTASSSRTQQYTRSLRA